DRARLGFPGSRFGVILGTRHLAGLIGGQRARETLVEGKILDAVAAHTCGLLSELCETDKLDARVEELLARAMEFDPETLRTLLRLTRQPSSASDMDELMRSTAREGLAERMRTHTRKVLPAKAKER
ncbi:MAG: enoyl-CoA hydratase/isomerase family protein, partial [Vulcanimicrobiaceae bacterium]